MSEKLKKKILIISWLLCLIGPIVYYFYALFYIRTNCFFDYPILQAVMILGCFIWVSGLFLGGVFIYINSDAGKKSARIRREKKEKERQLEKKEPSYTISVFDSNNKIIEEWYDAISIKEQKPNFICFRRRNCERYISISGGIISVVPNS